MSQREPYTVWRPCSTCDGADRNCWACCGDGCKPVRVATCHYCGCEADVLSDSELNDLACQDCAWEMA